MPAVEPRKRTPMRFEGVTPILPVKSLERSLAYYVKVLGFKVDWQDPGVFASVSRDRSHLFLCEGDQGHPGTWVWIGVSDVDALFAKYRRRRARLRHPPTNQPWACEMQVEDPDGNVLRLGSEPKKNRPFGEWLDMKGRAWVRRPEGGWERAR